MSTSATKGCKMSHKQLCNGSVVYFGNVCQQGVAKFSSNFCRKTNILRFGDISKESLSSLSPSLLSSSLLLSLLLLSLLLLLLLSSLSSYSLLAVLAS